MAIVRIAFVVALVAGSFLGMRQISGTDRIFFQPSLSGAKGLAWYLAGRYEYAAKEYRAHWRAGIPDGITSHDEGTDLVLAGKLDAAERLGRERLTRAPRDVSARLLRAEVALERDAPAEAIRLATEALAIAPNLADAQVMLALAHARAGDPGKAIDTLNRALRWGTMGERLVTFYQLLETTGTLAQEPAASRPLCLLAHLHRYFRVFDRSHVNPATRYARQAILAGDRPADAYLTFGIIAEKTGRLDDALAAFRGAIEVDPHHAEAYRWAAVVYGQRGDLVNEYRMITTAFMESRDPYYANHLFTVLIDKVGEPARAVELLTPLLARAPNDAGLWAQLGQAHALMGHAPEALEHFQRAVALAPQSQLVLANIGWSLNRLGKTEEAIAAYQRAIALAPRSPEAHRRLMSVYYEDRRYRAAIAEGETALQLGDPNLYTHVMLCNLYHYVADLERGEACSVRLLARDPGNSFALQLLPKFRHEASLR